MKFAGNYHGHSDALLAAGGSGVATLGLPRLGRRDRRRRSPDGRGALQRRARARRRRRLRDRRAGRRQHGPGRARSPASSRGCGPSATAVGALLVFDEVITGFRVAPRRRPGAVRRAPRPHLLRQGDRRRPADRRLRRPGRRHGRASRRSGPCTRPARCRGTRWPPRPAWPRSTCSTPEVYDAARPPAPRRLAAGLRRRLRRRRRPGARCRSVGPLVGLHFGATPRRRLRHGQDAPTRPLYAAFFHAMLRPRASPWPRAPYEVAVPGPGPHRRRPRRDRHAAPRPPSSSHLTRVRAWTLPVELRRTAAVSWRAPGGRGRRPPCRRLGRAELVGAQQVGHDPQHPLHERAALHADPGQLPHQRRAPDDLGEQPGHLEVLAVLGVEALARTAGARAGRRSASASWSTSAAMRPVS